MSDRFDLSTSTVHLLIIRSIEFISSLSVSVIKWPTLAEMEVEATKVSDSRCYRYTF